MVTGSSGSYLEENIGGSRCTAMDIPTKDMQYYDYALFKKMSS